MNYHSDNDVTIYCGDSRKLVHEIDGYDLIITGPPYAIGINYGIGKDDWLADRSFWKALYDRSMPETVLVVHVSTGLLPWWMDEIRAALWKYQHCMSYINPDLTNRRFLNFPKHWEPVLVFSKSGVVKINQEAAMHSSDLFTIQSPQNSWYRYPPHPCHADYYTWLRILSQFNFNTLLDPFMGIGTALLCARALGKKSIGIDQSPDYCKQAVEFLKQPPKH